MSVKMRDDGVYRKSSFSRIITWCVEASLEGNTVRVRDSKDRELMPLTFNHAEWDAFIKGVKAGEFDLP